MTDILINEAAFPSFVSRSHRGALYSASPQWDLPFWSREFLVWKPWLIVIW